MALLFLCPRGHLNDGALYNQSPCPTIAWGDHGAIACYQYLLALNSGLRRCLYPFDHRPQAITTGDTQVLDQIQLFKIAFNIEFPDG